MSSSAARPVPHNPLSDDLPWLNEPLKQTLQHQRAHAVLAVGAPGVGQLSFALGLARAWLCEAQAFGYAAPGDAAQARWQLGCSRCASCLLVAARTHPDLLFALPQAAQESLGWTSDGDEGADAGEGKGKPKASNEIKVEAIRRIVSFAQQTTARGIAKVIVIYPAEQMNAISANTLLKTLEEPPGRARFVLGSGAPDRLLPTIRSRCQTVRLPLPDAAVASAWLQQQGVAAPDVLLAACGGQPLSALEQVMQGLDAGTWQALPGQVMAGAANAMAGWPVQRVIDALQKLCIDTLRVFAGLQPMYFPRVDLPAGSNLMKLTQWAAELRQARLHAEHPWNAHLQVEALVARARAALQST